MTNKKVIQEKFSLCKVPEFAKQYNIGDFVYNELKNTLDDLNVESIITLSGDGWKITVDLDPEWIKQQAIEPTAKGLQEYLEGV